MPCEGPAAAIAALDFLPIGPIAPELARDVVARVSRAVAVPCRLEAACAVAPDAEVPDDGAERAHRPQPSGSSRLAKIPRRDDEGQPFVRGRDQWDADRLLADLEARCAAAAAGDGTVLVGLAARDIGNPVFTHFFGRARAGGRAALVSLARLDPAFYGLPSDADATSRRAAIEVLHELGHVAGLGHCAHPTCLMRFAPHVEAIDLRGTSFCAACRARIPHGLLQD